MIMIPIFLLLLFCGVPILLTIFNVYNLFAKKAFKPNIIDSLIFTLGIIYTWMLYALVSPVFSSSIITPVDSFYNNHIIFDTPLLMILAAVAFIGYALMRISKIKLQRPLESICIGAMVMGIIVSLVWSAHIVSWVSADPYAAPGSLFLCLFPFNYIVSSAALLRAKLKGMKAVPETGAP